jgi:protein-S-isoprenylcysteine O-methyltransferase Ste14
MIILFFIVWIVDSLSFFISGHSTVLVGIISLPILILPAIFSTTLGLYLITKSHNVVLVKKTEKPRFIDSGVYSLVRHPMYLGIIMFCLGFFFISPSLVSLGIWIAFFIICDKMATYEEKDLVRILGKKYINYQNKVPKWFPKI